MRIFEVKVYSIHQDPIIRISMHYYYFIQYYLYSLLTVDKARNNKSWKTSHKMFRYRNKINKRCDFDFWSANDLTFVVQVLKTWRYNPRTKLGYNVRFKYLLDYIEFWWFFLILCVFFKVLHYKIHYNRYQATKCKRQKTLMQNSRNRLVLQFRHATITSDLFKLF